jgi:uncharacterized hydrophobic protein (TIGR00271 family)
MPDTSPPTTEARSGELGRALALMQDRVAATLGVSRARRIETVVTMLDNNARRVPGYWIQLFLAMGIATLGLVVGSTAVVIGGMLVSPLMGPIIELGMGFAIGSSLLVIRASMRVVLSVGTVVVGAALLTLALPFHEVTGEIAARAAPTALDLLVAVFCALTAAYTAVRASADTTAAAAGTAIGIALVPPLCTAGFGIGTAAPQIARGAALLFTANFSAILVFAVLSFLMLGFNQVDAAVLEHDFLERDATAAERVAERAHAALHRIFGSRYGLSMRILVPLVFLLSVYVPLGRALDEVSWEIRTRASLRRVLALQAPRAVQTSLVVERHSVALRLLVVGTPDDAIRLSRRLRSRIAALAAVAPSISVIAVPNAAALDSSAAEATSRAVAAPAPPLSVADLAPLIDDVLRDRWPSAGGPLAGWRMDIDAAGPTTLIVSHLGPSIGPAGESLLARDVAERLRQPLRVRALALPTEALVAVSGRENEWLDSAAVFVDRAARVKGLVACVAGRLSLAERRAGVDRVLLSALRAAAHPDTTHVAFGRADKWSVRIARGTCTPSATAAKADAAGPKAPAR